MPTYSVSKVFPWHVTISDKVAAVMRLFGLTAEQVSKKSVSHNCTVRINDGDIVYITGPSGSGKSVLLRELEKSVPDESKINLNEIALAEDRAVIDCIEGELLGGLKLLSTAGLNDCLCILNRPVNLSDGQKWRFRLAMAIASGKKFIFADEFCSELDRVSAAVIAYNIGRFAKREGVTFILAASQDDILIDLAPDVLITKDLAGPTEVVYKGH